MKTEDRPLPLPEDQIREFIQKSREKQGLPPHVEDPSVLAKVVALLGESPNCGGGTSCMR